MEKIRVLLADKREIFREGLARLLKEEPAIEVVSVCSAGPEVIENARKHQPDVMLIDTELPECSVIGVIEDVRKYLSNTGIIAFTHSETDSDLLSTIQAGARAYISKDITIENLIRAIAMVANGEVFVSRPMAESLLAGLSLSEGTKEKARSERSGLLTSREHEVLTFVAQGLTNKDVAAALSISKYTVSVHMHHIMEKLHARTRQQAVALIREMPDILE